MDTELRTRWQQVELLVADAELLERTVPARHNADHRLEGVVGQSGQRHHPVARPQHPEERCRVDGVGWIDNIIYFDGKDWVRMDPTFAASGGGASEYVGDGSNYHDL